MLVKQELINKIKDYFDLNVYETKVWLALIGKGSASAGEIAELSGVPRSRTYDVLETLEKKGFAIVKLGKPVKYLGVKPRMILDKLRNNVRSEAEERIQSLSNIKDTEEFAQLEEIYKGGVDPVKREDVSAAIKGRSNISNYLREIIRNAKREVLICASARDILSKTKLFQQTFNVLKKENIKIRLCLSGEDNLIKKAENEFGIKIKKVDVIAKFFIIDREEILFYLSKPDSKEESAIWLNSEFFSAYFASLFELAFGVDKKEKK
ncbi:TrmB family transcriptional regulator [Candidatus Pacearchaeota archaeon]|jgi:sugar-specific transcriptional regulator TrmB|nr:TrmB family transcriptional regulator [Candidatus Pacearchaeota archaeon]